MLEEVLVTELPDDGGRRVPGEPLRPPVRVPDPPPAIDAVDAVVEMVDNRALEPAGGPERPRVKRFGGGSFGLSHPLTHAAWSASAGTGRPYR